MADFLINPPEPQQRKPILIAVAFFLLLIVIALLTLLPRLQRDHALEQESAENAGPPPVSTVTLATGASTGLLTLPGSVQAFDQTPIYARTNGYVKARYVDIGDHVRKGQLLAVIEDPQTDQALRQAQAAVVQLKAALAQAQANEHLADVTNQRWAELYKQGVVSRQDADTQFAGYGAQAAAVNAADANIAAGQANVHSLQEQQSFERVTAPFDGVILARSIDTGSLISSGSANSVTQMFAIGQAGKVRVFTNVPQADAASMTSGQKATVAIRELPGSSYTGTVNRTSDAIDPSTRTLLVEVDLENKDQRILPGMYATVQFSIADAAPPVMLPDNALIMRSAGPQAAVVDSSNVVHFHNLILGRDNGTSVEVLSGLQPGDVVVESAGDRVVDGAQVRPVQTAAPQP
ncbi:MAG TPA: efflux RND transporter periplasmic adaptor subunit [Acidobacteriaceae bacterium]|jgi:RND family efflux transporter MFP subunit|nr:efflux RND transporter periplasmic adaptor subunit [Acidobacteriaceae bacterium]